MKTAPFLVVLIGIFFLTAARVPDANAANPSLNIGNQTSGRELAGGWHFVRTPDPRGDHDAISIMHIADSSRSDLELAGLTIRCSKGGTELVVVLLRSFPPRARPQVVVGTPGHETAFTAKVVPPGTAVLLPAEATVLLGSLWHTQKDLIIRVHDGQSVIRGVVTLSGLESAHQVLTMSCPAQ